MRLHRLRFDIWLCLLVAYLQFVPGHGAAALLRPQRGHV